MVRIEGNVLFISCGNSYTEWASIHILQEANQKASNILREAKEPADAAIRNINKYCSVDGDI